MAAPEILLPHPMRPIIAETLQQHFTVHKAYEAADPEAFMDAVAENIRAIAVPATKVDKSFIDRFPNLEIVCNFNVGYDNIDTAYCASKGIIATNTPDVLTEEVADLTLGLLLMTVRELSSAERWLREGHWAKEGSFHLTQGSLRGRSLGILGLGRIGKAVAHRCEAFGVEMHYHGRHKQDDVPYMPRFTAERLSRQHILDIQSYLQTLE